MYYCRVNGQIYGPYSEEYIKKFIADGRITSESELSTDRENWKSANQLFCQLLPPPFLHPHSNQDPSSLSTYYEDPNIDPNLSFWGYYKLCWKKYADVNGRARRKEYWAWTVFNIVFSMILVMLSAPPIVIAATLGEGSDFEDNPLIFLAFIPLGLMVIWFFTIFCPNICVIVRRLHDINKPGWLAIFLFVPYVNLIASWVFFIFSCIDGTSGPNQYGPDPKGRS